MNGRGAWIVLAMAVAAAGCAGSRSAGHTERGLAPVGAVFCARDEVLRMGYRVLEDEPVRDRFRASRHLAPQTDGGPASTAFLTVSVVEQEQGGPVLEVHAARYARGMPRRPPGEPAPPERGFPHPPGTDTLPRVGNATVGTGQRLPPGPAAYDAQTVVRRCSQILVGG